MDAVGVQVIGDDIQAAFYYLSANSTAALKDPSARNYTQKNA